MKSEDTYQRFKHYHLIFKRTNTNVVFPTNIKKKIIKYAKGDILDIGTGDGYKLKNLLDSVYKNSIQSVTVIEPSSLFNQARRRLVDIRIPLRLYNLSIGDAKLNKKFDTIFLFEII